MPPSPSGVRSPSKGPPNLPIRRKAYRTLTVRRSGRQIVGFPSATPTTPHPLPQRRRQAHFASWCRRQGVEALAPDPRLVGLYITACASGKAAGDRKPNAVSTIERRLSSLTWNYAQRGQPLDRKDRHIATVTAGIRNSHAAPPRQQGAILPEDLIAMLETLDRGTLRGLRHRAMLLVGFAGALRRSEIVGLDCGRDQGCSQDRKALPCLG